MLIQKAGVAGKAIAFCYKGAIQVLRNADRGGGVDFSGKKRYEGVWFNVIIVTRGWVGAGPVSRKQALRNT